MTPTTTDSTWFTSTSDKLYDRHYYTINKKRFDDYDQLRQYWWQQTITNQTVIVHDYKKKKGFS
ncbi:hypothetical protein RW291109_057 [Cyanophage S-RIM12_RW_29_1109]|uniref:DUF7441 domain-containing protein n=3 Tax=Brizovirus syn33 TaxID=2734097 RepID=A0A1D7STP7_9CAUD|nr:hypothetical protein Syn33_061 [Prochlorococcus phage Syn33]AOO16614.1 hypothetical protein RW071112_057 [Cyanophage S-RIM12_RW_07_1112]AOO16830.1 hypothetical protein RW140101_057 [Cyanophage S-RIM12_RW_14_0101]AOO17045.1 hypothetical protein RW220110_057 [Cyanophage S-RIM12_RW_22_0110]AOO17906.1 hypothetical protein RW291109_057 [Cyanophage S-RIM12_RW_29_1109]ADO99722.1 hypothetical protein Syn33_061 [Prochlorococcus phage Syn33]